MSERKRTQGILGKIYPFVIFPMGAAILVMVLQMLWIPSIGFYLLFLSLLVVGLVDLPLELIHLRKEGRGSFYTSKRMWTSVLFVITALYFIWEGMSSGSRFLNSSLGVIPVLCALFLDPLMVLFTLLFFRGIYIDKHK